MEKAIWKFELKMTSEVQEIELPMGAQIISAAFQGRIPCLWAICPMNATTQTRSFVVMGTGWEVSIEWWNRLHHIETLHSDNGFVWHIFEVK